MVYCGRPSKGCAPCRAKRTKCDQARPYCGQCRRARRECPGYREERDLFRNENSKIMSKAHAGTAYGKSNLLSPTPIVEQVQGDSVPDLVTDFFIAPDPMVERRTVAVQNFSAPLGDEATYYFFHNFVSEDPRSRNPRNAYSQVLPTLYRQDSPFGVLPKIIDAIGLAGISNVQRSPELMVAAGRKYAKVLRAINASIQDSRQARTDQTLIAVMLLGMFETVTCSSPESMRSWANHIHGASAMVRLRGTDQLHTKIGRKMFAILRLQILIDCLQRRLIVPPDFIEWAEIAAEADMEQIRPDNQLFPIIGRLCALRATADRSSNNDIAVVTLAKFVDSDLEDWKNGLPPVFSYSTIQTTSTEAVFSDAYHVYEDTWTAAIWNLYRCARILTQQVITQWLSRNPMPNPRLEPSQQRQSEALFANLGHGICASVPFLLGASHSSVSSSTPPKAMSCTAIIWPLYVAATMEPQIAGMRAWVITRLELIGRTTGIKQAESLAHVLRTKREITAWDKFETVRADEEVEDW